MESVTFNSEYIAYAAIALVVFGQSILPPYVQKLAGNPFVQGILLFIVMYLAQHDMNLAVIVGFAFMFMIVNMTNARQDKTAKHDMKSMIAQILDMEDNGPVATNNTQITQPSGLTPPPPMNSGTTQPVAQTHAAGDAKTEHMTVYATAGW